MGYEKALEKAWDDLKGAAAEKPPDLKLLGDEYHVDLDAKSVSLCLGNSPAKEYQSILILHYLITKARRGKIPDLTGEWIGFNRLELGEAYYPVFRKRVIGPILQKYGKDPISLTTIADKMPAERIDGGDAAISLTALDGVPIRIIAWKGDEEFGPDLSILFDRSIKDVFCTEDIVVLSEFMAHKV